VAIEIKRQSESKTSRPQVREELSIMRLIESRHGFQFDDDACADNQVYTLTRYGDAPILNGHRALPFKLQPREFSSMQSAS